MAWSDRDYAQGRPDFGGNPLMWLLSGRVPLFRIFGVQVMAHSSMLVVAVLVLLFGTPFGRTPLDRMVFIVVLFGVVLLHEFGHVFAARWSGGEANEIEMTPLGGLALTMPGKGWWRHTITIVGGPAINVIICVACGATLFGLIGRAPLGPFSFGTVDVEVGASAIHVAYYVYYVYAISYFLLLFNLLPVYPLDGGQMLQGLLWWKLGWYRATLYATAVGMVGSILMFMWAIPTASILLAFIGIFCFITCFRLHKMLKAEGPWGFSEMDEPDYTASLKNDEPTWRERRAEAKAERRLEQEQQAVAAKAAEIDRILEKIGRTGRASLTRGEARTLEAHRAELLKTKSQ